MLAKSVLASCLFASLAACDNLQLLTNPIVNGKPAVGQICRYDQNLHDIDYPRAALLLNAMCVKNGAEKPIITEYTDAGTTWHLEFSGCQTNDHAACSDLFGKKGQGDGGAFKNIVDSCKINGGRFPGGLIQHTCDGLLSLDPVPDPNAPGAKFTPATGSGRLLDPNNPCDNGVNPMSKCRDPGVTPTTKAENDEL